MPKEQNDTRLKLPIASRKLRSFLLVSCLDAAALEKAFACAADCVVLDLTGGGNENLELASILPASLATRQPQSVLFALISHPESGKTGSDLLRIMPLKPAGVVLPKATGYSDVARLAAMLAVEEAEHGLEDGSTNILAMAGGSSAGTMALPALVAAAGRARKRLVGISWNQQALLAELGTKAKVSPPWNPCYLARSMTLMAARAAGICAIDTASPNSDTFSQECQEAAAVGFDGKFATDPSQVDTINETFAAES